MFSFIGFVVNFNTGGVSQVLFLIKSPLHLLFRVSVQITPWCFSQSKLNKMDSLMCAVRGVSKPRRLPFNAKQMYGK